MTTYRIQSRIAGQTPWSPEGSGDEFDTIEEAEAAMPSLEPLNDDGDALEYRVVADEGDDLDVMCAGAAATPAGAPLWRVEVREVGGQLRVDLEVPEGLLLSAAQARALAGELLREAAAIGED